MAAAQGGKQWQEVQAGNGNSCLAQEEETWGWVETYSLIQVRRKHKNRQIDWMFEMGKGRIMDTSELRL